MTVAPRQLLAFRFSPGFRLEGGLIGALERIESGGTIRVVDGLFVGRETDNGELYAVSAATNRGAGMIGSLLSFRLDRAERARVTERALRGRDAAAIESLAATLDPGEAIAVLLLQHAWALALGDSIERMGGTQLLSEFVDADSVVELPAQLAEIRGR